MKLTKMETQLTPQEVEKVKIALQIVKYHNHNPDLDCSCEICRAVETALRFLNIKDEV